MGKYHGIEQTGQSCILSGVISHEQVTDNVRNEPSFSISDRSHFFLARVPLALAEEDDEGSEMDRREKSSIAFFDGLSLISSPDNRAEKKNQSSP